MVRRTGGGRSSRLRTGNWDGGRGPPDSRRAAGARRGGCGAFARSGRSIYSGDVAAEFAGIATDMDTFATVALAVVLCRRGRFAGSICSVWSTRISQESLVRYDPS